jgi:hypothetical protein
LADGPGRIEKSGIIGFCVFPLRTAKEEVMAVVRSTGRPKGPRKALEADLGFSWGALNSLLLGAGVLVLAAGYVALSKGSTTLAPILLVSGYCGLVPASLLLRGRKEASGE